MESDSGTVPTVSGRVEGTRVNTGLIIDELLKNTKLDHLEESGSKYLGHMLQNVKVNIIMCLGLSGSFVLESMKYSLFVTNC